MSINVSYQIIDSVINAGVWHQWAKLETKKHEQVSIVLKYYDERLNVLENCIGFYKIDEMDGGTL